MTTTITPCSSERDTKFDRLGARGTTFAQGEQSSPWLVRIAPQASRSTRQKRKLNVKHRLARTRQYCTLWQLQRRRRHPGDIGLRPAFPSRYYRPARSQASPCRRAGQMSSSTTGHNPTSGSSTHPRTPARYCSSRRTQSPELYSESRSVIARSISMSVLNFARQDTFGIRTIRLI
ncbi:hypothetical protein EI94DRAFT_1742999 [Lactarius quietus]|nr:hypothetical protein EI94DRAFT_1742999 [Lactarius quietus]